MRFEKQKSFLGHFTVQGTDRAGALVLDGPKSKLEIYAEEFLHLSDEEMICVCGVSKEGISISAIHCIPLVRPGSAGYYGKRRNYMTLWPNYVVLGPRYLGPEESAITAISFTFSQANNLFYDSGTFGSIIWEHRLSFGQAREILRSVRGEPKHRRRGGHLDLYYQWNRGPIIEAVCHIGTITAWNATRGRMPSPHGLDLRNRVRVTCRFRTPLHLEAAIRTVYRIMSFLELTAQSRQNLAEITFEHKDAPEHAQFLLRLPNSKRKKVPRLTPTDALINGGLHGNEFASALTAWMDTATERGAARERFMKGFRRGRNYTTDRLVGAANAFDLLPSTDFINRGALPTDVENLLADLESQVKRAAKGNNEVAEYKDRFLNNLGRIRSSNLRAKVLQRLAIVPNCVGSRLSSMPDAVAHSVRARNFFVHGSEIGLSADAVHEFSPFFTDTLEFVFGVSELCCCGWDAERWAEESFSLSRFKSYMSQFPENMNRLNVVLGTHTLRP